jgi:hypothetical protein
VPAVTALSSSSDSRMSRGRSDWPVSPIQRSNAILKTAVADEGVPIPAIAEVIGRHLDLPVTAIAPGKAAGQFGWLGAFLAIDSPGPRAR